MFCILHYSGLVASVNNKTVRPLCAAHCSPSPHKLGNVHSKLLLLLRRGVWGASSSTTDTNKGVLRFLHRAVVHVAAVVPFAASGGPQLLHRPPMLLLLVQGMLPPIAVGRNHWRRCCVAVASSVLVLVPCCSCCCFVFGRRQQQQSARELVQFCGRHFVMNLN